MKTIAEQIMLNKIVKTKKKILERIKTLESKLTRNNKDQGALDDFQKELFEIRKDLRSWPTSPKINLAVRRIDDILSIVHAGYLILHEKNGQREIDPKKMAVSMKLKNSRIN